MKTYLTTIFNLLKQFRGRFAILFVFLMLTEIIYLTTPNVTGYIVDSLSKEPLLSAITIAFIGFLSIDSNTQQTDT